MLAGIPNAPSVYAPTVNLDLAKQRTKQVIDAMVKYDVITQDEANRILKEGENYFPSNQSSNMERLVA